MANSQTPDSDFEQFYHERIEPAIPSVTRRKHAYRFAVVLATFGVFFGSLALFVRYHSYFSHPNDAPGERNWFSILLFAASLAAGAFYCVRRWLRSAYLRNFRRRVIAPIAQFAVPGMTYRPEGHFEISALEASLLFATGGEGGRYADIGLFSCERNGIGLRFSSLRAERRGRHGCRLKQHAMFGGLFLEAKTGKTIPGFVLAAPRESGLNEDVVAHRLKEEDARGVREAKAAGNPEFNLTFTAFASDRALAESVLTPELTNTMIDLWNSRGVEASYSRRGDACCLALASGRDHFHPPGGGERLDLAKCREYRDDIAACVALMPLFGGRASGPMPG